MTLAGGQNQSPLDSAAQVAIGGAQRVLGSAPRIPVTKQERDEIEKVAKDGGLCTYCAGIHAGAGTPACPRLASGKLNGDGVITEFTYWQEWDTDRVVFPENVDDESEEEV